MCLEEIYSLPLFRFVFIYFSIYLFIYLFIALFGVICFIYIFIYLFISSLFLCHYLLLQTYIPQFDIYIYVGIRIMLTDGLAITFTFAIILGDELYKLFIAFVQILS